MPLKQTKTDRALNASDPGAALVSGIIGFAGATGLLTRWGISADMLAEILGFGMMVAGGARAYFERARRERLQGDVMALVKTLPPDVLQAAAKAAAALPKEVRDAAAAAAEAPVGDRDGSSNGAP